MKNHEKLRVRRLNLPLPSQHQQQVINMKESTLGGHPDTGYKLPLKV